MKIDKNSNDYYYYVVRTNIKRYRIKEGLTAQGLADNSGFTHQYIRNLECLKLNIRPRLDTLVIISKTLNINIKDLFDIKFD